MRALLLILALAAGAARAQDDAPLLVQPHLFGLYLGDGLRDARRRLPPRRAWPYTDDRRLGVRRYRLEAADTKGFPPHLHALYLGFRDGELVEIEGVYDDDYSRRETYDKLARDYELLYGVPHQSQGRFWWDDGRTVLRVFPAELPAAADGAVVSSASVSSPGPSVLAWRTGVQIFRRSVFARGP